MRFRGVVSSSLLEGLAYSELTLSVLIRFWLVHAQVYRFILCAVIFRSTRCLAAYDPSGSRASTQMGR